MTICAMPEAAANNTYNNDINFNIMIIVLNDTAKLTRIHR